MGSKLKSFGFGFLYFIIGFIVELSLSFMILIVSFKDGINKNQAEFLEKNLFKDAVFNIELTVIMDIILIVLFGCWYYFIRRERDVVKINYRASLNKKTISILAVMGIAANYAAGIVVMIFSFITPTTLDKYNETLETFNTDAVPGIIMVLIVAILGPLAEELMFRCMIFRTLRKGFTFWPAAIISAAMFGIFHMDLIQGTYAFCFGIFLAYVYDKNWSLFAVWLMHGLFNGASFVMDFINDILPFSEDINSYINLGLTFVGLIITIIFVNKYVRYFNPKPKKSVIGNTIANDAA